MIAWMRRHWRDCPDRSRVAVPGKASQRAGASGFGGDPGASWVSAGANGTGQQGTRAGQELRRTLARLQRAQPRSGESRRAESGTGTGTEPLLSAIAERSQRICQYNEGIEALAQQNYPQVTLLKQIKGVGTLIALPFLLTLEDPYRFGKSRDVGGYLGLQPGRRKSGQSEPQMHISKEGDPYLRTLLGQGAQHILGTLGVDCDLRRWGLKLAARGGRSGKKRAIVATARKLAVLLHHLWVSGEVYQPLHNSSRLTVAAAA